MWGDGDLGDNSRRKKQFSQRHRNSPFWPEKMPFFGEIRKKIRVQIINNLAGQIKKHLTYNLMTLRDSDLQIPD